MFEFQQVPFAFSLILGDSFMVSPPLTKVWGNRRRDFFPKDAFHGGTNFVKKIYSGIVVHMGNDDQNILRGKEFQKMHFPIM